MTEKDASSQYLSIKDVPPRFAGENPIKTNTVLGEQVVLGEVILPSGENYPGWNLTLLSFPENPNKDGCIFKFEPNSTQPPGIVGKPDKSNSSAIPVFTEYIVDGSGFLLIQTPDGKVEKIEVSANNPKMIRYGEGSVVSYFGGEKGLVGVNIGEPTGVPEDTIDREDPRVSSEYWEKYDELKQALS